MSRRTSRKANLTPAPGVTAVPESLAAGQNSRGRRAWRLARFLSVCVAGVLVLAGCQNDEITRYKVPRVERPLNRLLGAIIPHQEKTWFVKLVGPEQAVKEQEEPFKEFLQSIHFTDKGDAPIAWAEPKGWRREPGEHTGRYAVFDLGRKDLELTVSALGREGKAASVPDNVNRWRGMLGLRPLPDEEVAATTHEVKLDGAVATVVDLVGPGSGKRAMRPHAPNAPPRPAPPPEAGEDRPPLTYQAPPDWDKLPTNQFRVAAFKVADKGEQAEVTVIPLPGKAGTPLGNVNRWRQQLGLPPINEEQLKQEAGALEVNGAPALYVDLLGPEKGASRQRTLAVSVPQGDRVWFFKMYGQADLVGRQKSAFEAFVKSARFQGGER